MHDFDSKQQTDLIMLDFSKAFDTVPHKKLPFKLNKNSINGNINKRIQSFLMHRSNMLLIKGSPQSQAPLTLEYVKVQFKVPCFVCAT